MTLDMHNVTMTDVATLLGYAKPVKHRQRICAACGSDELWFVDEITGEYPNGTGYRVLACAKCGEAVPDDGTANTRYYVGF